MKSVNIFFAGSEEALQNRPKINEDIDHAVREIILLASDNVKKECARLMKCDMLVTLEDWEKHETSVKLVEIARITGIAVVSHISLSKHIQHVANIKTDNRSN